LRGAAACDRSAVAQTTFEHVFHASGGIVKRNWLDLAVLCEQIATLIERHWVREHTPHITKLHTWSSDQVMNDTQAKLTDDMNIRAQQEIKVFGHGTGKRVLDWNDRCLGRSSINRLEDVSRSRAWHDDRGGHHCFGRLVAE